MKHYKTQLIIVAVIAFLLVGGLLVVMNRGNSSSPPATHTQTESTNDTEDAVATASVTIKGYAFTPAVIKIKVGDTVTWTNSDSVHHNIVADTAGDDAPNGPLFGQGETYSYTFKKAGSYAYHCGPHPYMHGTVVVTN